MPKYICGACNREIEVDNKKQIECYNCGGKVLYKCATTKNVQLVSK